MSGSGTTGFREVGLFTTSCGTSIEDTQVSSVWKKLADHTFPFWKEIEAYNEMDKRFSTTDNLKLFINLRAAFSQLTDGNNYPPKEYRLPTETSWLSNSNDGVTALDKITSGRINAALREESDDDGAVITEDRIGFVLRCSRWVRPTLDASFGEDKRLYERAILLGYSCSLHSAVINHDHNGVGYMFYPLDDQPRPTGNFHIIMPYYEADLDVLYAYNHCTPGDYGPVIYWCTMLVCQKGGLSEMSSVVTWPDPPLTRGMSVHTVLSEYESRRLKYAKEKVNLDDEEGADDAKEDDEDTEESDNDDDEAEEGIKFYAMDEEEAERPLWQCCECGTHISYTMCCHMIMFTRAEKASTEESKNHSDGGDADDHSEEEQSEEDEDRLIEEISKLRVVDLRAELKKRKQPVGGLKAELVARLAKARQDNDE
ncbi:regulatory protein [Planoprotostelium fungivorum]|uniref:Regulatory protein n=1 Tax=Planoprotostelium fungivorum TaxID=1890364 RepID=A0A2P6P0E4_9EUKA|nr:regulatory protein [Planoprotostelium fungivorum]